MATLDTRTVDAPHTINAKNTPSEDDPFQMINPEVSASHIRAASHLYGIFSPRVETARVLELGCGTGGNLLSFAAAYPQGSAIGVDLDDAAVSSGNQLVQSLGLTNVQLATASLDELLSSELGMFDYVIIHGPFSAVNESIRSALLEWAKRHLSERGVIAMAWNAYPGWKAAEVLRDAFQLHGSQAQSQDEKVASARAMLTYLSLGSADRNPLKGALHPLIEQAETQTDLMLSLRYLEGINEPCYLVDFHAMAAQNGLTFVGDVLPQRELAEHYGGEVAKLTDTVSPGHNKILRQQYLDFAVGRSERFSLLVPDSRANEILPEPALSRLKDFHWGGNFERVVTDTGTVTNTYLSGQGVTIGVNHDLTLHLMDVICDAWPHSVSFEQLVFNTRAPERQGEDEQHRQDVLAALKILYTRGISELNYSLQESRYNLCPASTVRLLPELATLWHKWNGAAQAITGFNFWHEKIKIAVEPSEIAYLQLLLEQKDVPLHAECYQFLERLRRAGALWGNPNAWQHYFQQLLQVFSSTSERYLGSLIIYASETSVGGYKKTSRHQGKSKRSKDVMAAPTPDKKIYQRIIDFIDNNDFSEARQAAQTLVGKMPDNLHYQHLLAQTYLKTNAFDESLAALMKTLSLHATSWSVYLDAAHVFWHTDKNYYAGRLARKILRCDPSNVATWNLLGALYKESNNPIQAEACLRKAEQYSHDDANILSNLASLLSNQGRMAEAVECFRRMRTLAPDNYILHSNYLFSLSHDVQISPEALFAEHCEFGDMVEKRAQQYQRNFSYSGLRDPERKLRIGFVSGDLCRHPVSNFLSPFWESLNTDLYSIHAFSTSHQYDDMSRKLQKSTQGWHAVYDKSDVELAALINQEQIDILFDLSGHTGFNRLPMFAFKPAPIQISWIGYPGTTGMRAMDYFLILNLQPLPESFDRQFTEKTLYVRSTQQFKPTENSPDVNELPAIKRGQFTFGSMNRMQKLNDYIFEAWAAVLKAVPNSRIIIGALAGQKNIDIIRAKLEALGVEPKQLLFLEKMGMHEYLAAHHEIDLLLDTYPYTGGTTTNHALWMGVPTLTISGETLPTQQGVAALQWLGLNGFVATSKADYVTKAVAWSTRLDELNQYRQEMRSKFERPKPDGITPATHFEEMLRAVWQDYCENTPAQSRTFGY
ncbi:methyltransferase regulatory domain-containing protein [Candidatus Symbiopectobacterium sp. NZEC127]|uniref:O-linked N-acetylglucosamine transferase family protein n=1 Tax=Candidatus Symbiopectobacterium sp. NZEC127 TaxID=2820472 RepID=UPI00222732AF|nr:methyltransferase regulatory domain-containing protein [Candidatus Symbiopectobacterium sp. NZEC127]MCW2485603.1 methyltransferase regulatory domain-containing protein [Candidatus Symbiopectobacterium sp. NZEC127]